MLYMIPTRLTNPSSARLAIMSPGDTSAHADVSAFMTLAGAKFERGQLVERPDGSGGDQQVA
jgi:hypothetical protein